MNGCFIFDGKQKIHLPKKADTALFSELVRSYTHSECELVNDLESSCVKIGTAEEMPTDGEAFAMNITENGVTICGEDYASAIRGFITLLDSVKYFRDARAYGTACGVTRESAAVKFRAVHICVFEQTDYDFLKKCVRACGIAKYSHIVLEFWGMLRYDCMKELAWEEAFSKEQVRAVVSEANALGIEIIPMFNHLGHAASARSIIGKHVVLDQNPEYEYMFNTYGWEWDFENEEVYELLAKVRSELIELCGEGKYFHLGCDEAYSLGFGENRGMALCKYLNRVQAELAEQGRRAIIWGDMLLNESDYKNEPGVYACTIENEKISETIRNNLSKDIIIADWQYYMAEETWKSTVELRNAGFDVVCCPWDEKSNTVSGIKNAMRDGVYGIMHTTWHTLNTYAGFLMMLYVGRVSWSGDFDVIHPKVLPFYAASTARKVLPSGGVYKKSGWCEKEIGPGLWNR